MKLMKRNRSSLSRKAGFTLLEMILVIALLMLLAGVAVNQLGGVLTGSNEKVAIMKVNESFKTPLFRYRLDMGNFPTSEEGLMALLQKPASDRGRWKGPYIENAEDMKDPWGNDLRYRFPGTKNVGGYDLYSLGPDAKESEDDIGNW